MYVAIVIFEEIMTDNDPDREVHNRRQFLRIGGASAIGMTGLAGCLTGGGSGGGAASGDGTTASGETTSGGSGSTDSSTDDSGTNGSSGDDGSSMDFGGKNISVILNVGPISTVHKKFLIPRVEEKYNLSINTQTAVTTDQLTQLQANPDSPPDVLIPDVIGIQRASQMGWLEPLSDHTDIVTELDNIYEKFVHYDSQGVSWEVGEVLPIINTSMWDSPPSTHAAAMQESSSTAAVPFSWSGGPYLLLMASAIATGESFDSKLDVDAGFNWLQENFESNVSTTYQGVASAKQQLASGNVDALNLFWDYMVFDMWQQDAPIDPLFRLEPKGIAFAESVAVPNGSNNMDAALAYANECLSPQFQEQASAEIGCGVTNKNASVAPAAKEFGATTSDEFDQLAFPDFEYIWNNRSDWAQRWNQIFSG
jgi:putative spermidine/putrescine transport system substrate-binding protein